MSSNGVGTVATVTCDHGYSMTGEPRLTCGADGKWNQNVPSCGNQYLVMSVYLELHIYDMLEMKGC